MPEKVTIQLDQLHFDPENPRLPTFLPNSEDEEEVIDFLIKHGNIIELMASIAQIGYSDAEPLLVVPKAGTSRGYFVVEGNRRLAALKLLSNPDLAKVRKNSVAEVIAEALYRPKEIPVILYEQKEEILNYLGYRHITGVKDWGALEKARYLDDLYQMNLDKVGEEQIYRVLAKMIGSRKDYVAKLHTAFRLYEFANDQAYFHVKIEEDDVKFSYLTTALGYSGVVSYLGLSSSGDSSLKGLEEENYEQLFVWLYDPKKRVIFDTRELSDLNKILESESAIKKLEQGSDLKVALLYTTKPVDTFNELILSAKDKLQNSKNIIEQLGTYPEHILDVIEEIEKICKSIRGAIHEHFPTSEILKGIDMKGLTPEQLQNIIKSLAEKLGE